MFGGFYFYKRRDVDYNYRGTVEFLRARNLTGLPDEYYQRFGGHAIQHEKAAFGELSYHFTDRAWVTGGLRYTDTDVQAFTEPGGYNSSYLGYALGGLRNVAIPVFPVPAAVGQKVKLGKWSYKASASIKPVESVTAYATVSTGFRSPVANARGGAVSTLDPTDLVIPFTADSDSLTNYEIGVKGDWLGGRLRANIAAYYIDWKDIQVQVNRVSDSVQFATNIGAAVSKGIEFEIAAKPMLGLGLFFNGSINRAKVTELTAQEAAISGAVKGSRLAFPRFQGSATARYDFLLNETADAYVSAQVAYVGKFPGLFPNQPGRPTQVNVTYDWTDNYTTVNLFAGADFGKFNTAAYVENLFNSDAITYVHPEAFLDGRYAKLRPLTVGIRLGYDF